jgi:uncharacterized protein (DUF952 family)
MKSDLIFHIVSKRKWRALNKDGYYRPEGFDAEDSDEEIECITSERINEFLNSHFTKRKNLLLLVIDKSRIINRIRTEKEKGLIFVERGINTDAILDKIRIDANQDGNFDVEFDLQ